MYLDNWRMKKKPVNVSAGGRCDPKHVISLAVRLSTTQRHTRTEGERERERERRMD